jgi:hypothetical protein
MIEKLKSIFKKEPILPRNFDFDLSFFLNESHKQAFETNGYTIVNNVVSEIAIQKILAAYQLLSIHKDFYPAEGFITSANYGKDVQIKVHKVLSDVTLEILPLIFDLNKVHYNLLNTLVLKFCKDTSSFFPHQDVSFVEENKGVTILAWIPTENIDQSNGSLLVLPKSHQPFRWQHTHDQTNSPLSHLKNDILKDMIPVYLNKGDLVLFDNTLIHASSPNKTNEVRIVMNTGLASKTHELIHYKILPHHPTQIEKFKIDEDFWHSGNFMTPNSVPEKYGRPIIEKIRRTKKYALKEYKKTMNL